MKKLFDEIIGYGVEDGKEFYRLDNLTRDELIETFVEIDPVTTDTFLKIKETLTRIGIATKDRKTLYQSAMIFHKRGRFFITHFKELFGMDGKYVEMTKDDYLRRNRIANLLEEWDLIKIKNRDRMYCVVDEMPINVFIVSYKDKTNWNLQTKYNIGGYLKKGNK